MNRPPEPGLSDREWIKRVVQSAEDPEQRHVAELREQIQAGIAQAWQKEREVRKATEAVLEEALQDLAKAQRRAEWAERIAAAGWALLATVLVAWWWSR